MPAREEIVQTARSYVRTPFGHQGRVPHVVLDCAGEIICLAWAHGYAALDFDIRGYSRWPRSVYVLGELGKFTDKLRGGLSDARIADIFVTQESERIVHMGLLVNGSEGHFNMLHATQRAGYVVEHVMSDDWRAKVRAVYRFRGLE